MSGAGPRALSAAMIRLLTGQVAAERGSRAPPSPISSVTRSRQQGREAERSYRMPPQRLRRMG